MHKFILALILGLAPALGRTEVVACHQLFISANGSREFRDLELEAFQRELRDRSSFLSSRVFEKLAVQASRLPAVREKILEVWNAPMDAVTKELFLEALAEGATDLKSFLQIAAHRELVHWIPIYVGGGPGPHYIGDGLRYQLGAQAPEVFFRFSDPIKKLPPHEQYSALNELSNQLQSGLFETNLLGKLNLKTKANGFLAMIDGKEHSYDAYAVGLRWHYAVGRVKKFTVTFRPKWKEGAKQDLNGLKGIEFLDMAYHMDEPTLGHAFHVGELKRPLMKRMWKEGRFEFDQILVEQIVDRTTNKNGNLDLARSVADIMTDGEVAKQSKYIKIKLFKEDEQIGVNSLLLPLDYERDGKKIYRRTFDRGWAGLGTKLEIELEFNTLTQAVYIKLHGKVGNITYRTRAAEFQ